MRLAPLLYRQIPAALVCQSKLERCWGVNQDGCHWCVTGFSFAMIGCLSIQIVQRHLFLCPLPLFVCIGLVQDQYAHNHIIVNWSGDARLTSTKHCSLRDTRHIQSNLPATGKAGPHRPPVMLWSRTWCRRRLMLGTNLTVNIWRLRFSLRFSRLPGSVCGWTDVDLQTQEVVGPFCSKCEDVMSLAWFILYAVLSNCCRCNINTVSHVLNSPIDYPVGCHSNP